MKTKKTTTQRYSTKNLLKLYPPNTYASTLASVFGVTRSAICKWRNHDVRLGENQADKHAVRLGYHPFEIWPEWFQEDE